MEALSEDLLNDILHRLPLKALGLCMCVKKAWRNIIKSSSFVSSTINKGEKGDYLIVSRNCQLQLHDIANESLDVPKILTVPFRAQIVRHTANTIAICNGVICLATKGNIILWNPFIRKTLALPRPNFDPFYADFLLGFSFDSLHNDYKIIKKINGFGSRNSVHFEIFSLSKNLWRDISDIAPIYDTWGRWRQIFNGALHSICHMHPDEEDRKSYAIIDFDVTAEVFREINLPQFFDQRTCLELELYKESYMAICCSYNEGSCLEIWVMKDYGSIDSLENVWKIDWAQFHLGRPPTNVEGFGFQQDGQVWWCRIFFPAFCHFSIDLTDNTVQQPERKHDLFQVMLFRNEHIRRFQESLLLLDNTNAQSY